MGTQNNGAMRRRQLIGFAGTALFAWPLVRAHIAVESRASRIPGFRHPAASATRVEALRAGLRDLGYVEGKNLVIEFRWASTVEQMHEAAAELARMKVDIIFATSSTESEPARRATSTIPIVFATHADPWARTCRESRAAGRKHDRLGRHTIRDHPKAAGDTEGHRAAGDPFRRALDPHRPVRPALPASRRSTGGKLRSSF